MSYAFAPREYDYAFALRGYDYVALRRAFPALGRQIGKGAFSLVFEHRECPERVFKLTADPATVAYLSDGLRPRGPHFPEVFCDHGVVLTVSRHDYSLFEIERLQRLGHTTLRSRVERLVQTYYDACVVATANSTHIECAYSAAFEEVARRERSKTMREALEQLGWFVLNFQFKPDLTVRNFMRRGRTIVFSDPVYA